MGFTTTLSRSAGRMRPSPIRELFKLIQRPGMISFAGGLPDPAIFPVEAFADCASALREHGTVALQYGASEGYGPLVEILRARMTPHLGRAVPAEEMIVASGSQQVMDMLSRVLLDPGDTIVVEAPTYPGALHTFRNAGARFALVPCDGEGMCTEALPAVIEHCRQETGQAPRLIYTIVNFSNPSGASMTEARRRQLAEVARRQGILVFEDDPYGDLRYSGDPLPSLYSLAGGEGVLYASSFSKILAPGVRVAWAVGDPTLIRAMVVAKQGMDLCTSMVSQVLVAEYCRRGHLDRHLATIRGHYAAKRDAMAAALATTVPGHLAAWSDPTGGFFFWLRLVDGDAATLFHRAVEEKVAFLPGPAFFPAGEETVGPSEGGSGFARLCFTFASPEEIAEGGRRFARALSVAGGSAPRV